MLQHTVYSGYSGHVYKKWPFGHSGHFSWYKIHLVYFIQVRYSGQSDIVARKCWPKVASISKVHCITVMVTMQTIIIYTCKLISTNTVEGHLVDTSPSKQTPFA